MKLFFFSMALCAVLMINETARSQCSRDLIGTWHAQNATLTITAIAAGGRVTGSYTLPSGAPRVLFPVMGWVNPVAPASKKIHVVPIVFTVQLEPSGNIIVWSGYLSRGDDGTLSIITIWKIVQASPDPDFFVDNSVINATVFKPGHFGGVSHAAVVRNERLP